MDAKIALAAVLLLSAAMAANVTVTKSLIKCTGLGNCTGVQTTTLYANMNDYVLVLVEVSNGDTKEVSGMVWDSVLPTLEFQNGTMANDANLSSDFTGMFANYSEALNSLTIAGVSGFFPTQRINDQNVPKFPSGNKPVGWGINPAGVAQFVQIPGLGNRTFSYLIRVPDFGVYNLGKAYFVTNITGMEINPIQYETSFCSYPGGSVSQRFTIHAVGQNLTNALVTYSPVTLIGNSTPYVSLGVVPLSFGLIPADALRTFTATISVAPGTPSTSDANPYLATIYASADEVPQGMAIPVYIRVNDCGIANQTLEPSIVVNPRNITGLNIYPPENRSVQFRTVNRGTAQGKVLISDSCGGVATPSTMFINPGEVRSSEVRYGLGSSANCSVQFLLRDAGDTITLQNETIPVNITANAVDANASIQFVNCTSGDPFPSAYNFSVSRAKSETVFCVNNGGNSTLTDLQLVYYPLSLTTAVQWSTDGSNYSNSLASLAPTSTAWIKLITDGQDAQSDSYAVNYKIIGNGAKDTIDSTVSLTPVSDVSLPAAISPLLCSQEVTITNPGSEITDLTVMPYGALANYLDLYPRLTKAYLGTTSVSFNLSFDSYRCRGDNVCSGTLAGGLNVTYNGKAFPVPITLPNSETANCTGTNAAATTYSNAYLSRGEAGYVLKTPAAVQTQDQNNGTTLSITFSGSSAKSVTVFLNGNSLGTVQMNATQTMAVDPSIITYSMGGTNVVALKSYEDISTINVNVTNVTLAFAVGAPALAITPTQLFLTLPPGGSVLQEFTLSNTGNGTVSTITLNLDSGQPGSWITIPATMPDLPASLSEAFTLNLNVPNDTNLLNQTFLGNMYVNSRAGTLVVPIQVTVSANASVVVIPYDEATNMTLDNMSVYIASLLPTLISRDINLVGVYKKPLDYTYIGGTHTVEVTDPNAEYLPARSQLPIAAGENVIRVPMRKGKILSVSITADCPGFNPETGCTLAAGQKYTITAKTTLPQLEYMIRYGFEVWAKSVNPDPITSGVMNNQIQFVCTRPEGCSTTNPYVAPTSGGPVPDIFQSLGGSPGYAYGWLPPGGELIFPPVNPIIRPATSTTPTTGVTITDVSAPPRTPDAAPAPTTWFEGGIRELYKTVTYTLVNSNVTVTATAYVDIPGETTVIQAGVLNGNTPSSNISFLDPVVNYGLRFCGSTPSSCLKSNLTAPLANLENITAGTSCNSDMCVIGAPLSANIGTLENITVFKNMSTEAHKTIHAQASAGTSATFQVGYNTAVGYYGVYANVTATLNDANATRYSELGYTLIRVVNPPRLVASVNAFSASNPSQEITIVKQGEFFIIRAIINNDNGAGGRMATGVTVSLSRLENLEVVGTNAKSLGSLPSGGTATVEWTVRATKRAIALLAEMRALSTEGAKGLALWSGVSEANVDLALDPNEWNWGKLPNCGSATKQFFMHNNGDIDLTVSFTRISGISSWLTASPSSMTIPSSGYTLLTLTVNIPCDAPKGYHTGIFEFVGIGRTATFAPLKIGGEVVSDEVRLVPRESEKPDRLLLQSNMSCTNESTVQNCSVTFDTTSAPSTSMTSPAYINATDGINGDGTISITNKNLVQPSVDAVFQSPVSWLSFVPVNLTVPQGATMNFIVRATLPRGTLPGTYQSPIYAIVNGSRDSTSVVRVTVPVLAAVACNKKAGGLYNCTSQTAMRMTAMLPGDSNSFEINVSNPSAVPVDVQMQSNEWVSYAFNTLTIASGDTVTIPGTFTVPSGTTAGGRVLTVSITVGGQVYSFTISVDVTPKFARQAFDAGFTSTQNYYTGSGYIPQCGSRSFTIYAQTQPSNKFQEASTAYISILPSGSTPVLASWFNATVITLPVPGSPGVASTGVTINIPCSAPAGRFYGIVSGYVSNGTATYSLNQLYLQIDIPADLTVSPTSIAIPMVEGDSTSYQIRIRNTNLDNDFTGISQTYFGTGSNPIGSWLFSLSEGATIYRNSSSNPTLELLTTAIQVPARQQVGTYTGTIRITGTILGATRYFDVPISITVHPKMTISTGSLALTVADGSSGSKTVTIYNNGQAGALSSVTLTPVAGYNNPLPAGWVAFTPYAANTPFSISSQSTQTVTAVISVPLVTPSGVYSGYVNITDSLGRLNAFTIAVTVPARYTGVQSASVTLNDGQQTAGNVYFDVANTEVNSSCSTTYASRTGAIAPLMEFNFVSTFISQTYGTAYPNGACLPVDHYRVPFSITVPTGTSAGVNKGAITLVTGTGVNQDVNVTVTVKQAITTSVTPTVATVQPGAAQVVTARVTNSYPGGFGNINGTVYVSGPIAAWSTPNNSTFSDVAFFTDLPFTINVPPTQDPGAYTGTFTAVSRQTYAASTTINVPAVIGMNATNITANVYDGIPLITTFTITDTNIQNANVSLTVTGLDSSLYSLSQTSLVMSKGQTVPVQLTFSAPNQYPSGKYSGKLRLTEAVSGKVIEIPLNFTLNSSLIMTPVRIFSEQVPDAPVVSQYSVKNNANVPITVNMTIEPITSSPLNLSWASGYGVTATIPAGATYLYNVTVTLPAEAIGYYTGRVKLTSSGPTRTSELIVKSAIDMVLDVC